MTKIKTKLKSGDLVKIIAGQHKGKIDYISKIDFEGQNVYLKSINRQKYDKSTPESKKESKLKEIMIPINISNVAYWLEEKKSITKLGFQNSEGDKKMRKSRKYNTLVN